MHLRKKIQAKLNRGLVQHRIALEERKKKSGANFNPVAFKMPGSRNPKKC